MNRHARIAVLTATYNSAPVIGGLVRSLEAQEDRDFEWVVADGGSTDGTLDIVRGARQITASLTAQQDFGVYDALNRAIRNTTADYYVVAGADDRFFPNAIGDFREGIRRSGADFIVADIMVGTTRATVRNRPSWLVGHSAYVAGHSVGTAIRRSLHEKFGMYSQKFSIAADQYFVLKACGGGATTYRTGNVAGQFGTGGVSSREVLTCITEAFQVHLRTHNRPFLITATFLGRLAKHARSWLRESGSSLLEVADRSPARKR